MSRCRYCYQSGHNRNSCPDAAKAAEAAKAKFANGANRWDLDWKERFAHDISMKKEARKVAGPSTTPRKCSYCSEGGHTRATCATLKSDRSTMIGLEKRYRVAIAKFVKASGVGVGAIVTRDPKHFNNSFSILVTGFSAKGFSLLTPSGGSDNFRGTYLDRKDWEGEATSFHYAGDTERMFGNRAPYIISAPGAPVEFPSNWTDDSEIEKRVSWWFDEKATRRTRWDDSGKGVYHTGRPNIERYTEQVKAFEAAV